MQTITIAERRARLAVRHAILPETRRSTLVDVARSVVCLHATDPSTVYLSAWARLADPSVDLVDRALYEDRELVRMLAMRRTMFVVAVEDAPILQAAASVEVARRERKRNEDMVAMLGVEDVRDWLDAAERQTLDVLSRLGEATAQELGKEVPALRERVRVNIGKKYEGDIGISSRVLLLLAAEGRIVRARPRGSWISSQYRWSTMERWLGAPLATLPPDEAKATLIGWWLERFGPGTEADLRWWTGFPARDVRRALATIDAAEVDLDGQTGYVRAGDLDSTETPGPWVALLPSLDPTTMGWQARDWYLGPHKSAIFDTAGNAGPTIWADGHIVGGWAIRPDGEVVTKLLEDVGRETALAVDTEAARLTAWLQSVRVIPRFPTPLYKELVGA